MRIKLKGPTKGTIVKIVGTIDLVDYYLDNGYTWSDSPGRHVVGDVVVVSPYIMGTVKVTKI